MADWDCKLPARRTGSLQFFSIYGKVFLDRDSV
ncbi:hypothetical protein JOD55_000746 [Arcanobacterium pluranimalium]|nr:hypothetical protein [Arcanobacterium pluranimalium]